MNNKPGKIQRKKRKSYNIVGHARDWKIKKIGSGHRQEPEDIRMDLFLMTLIYLF